MNRDCSLATDHLPFNGFILYKPFSATAHIVSASSLKKRYTNFASGIPGELYTSESNFLLLELYNKNPLVLPNSSRLSLTENSDHISLPAPPAHVINLLCSSL